MKDIQEKYPSICYQCTRARKPASDENTKKGYVGCALRVIQKEEDRSNFSNDEPSVYDHQEILEAKEISEGWVDLKSTPKLGRGSGMITNMMLLTLEVKRCKQFHIK